MSSVAMLHLSPLLKPNSLRYIFVKMTGGQQAAHETSTSKLNERASFEMMRPDAAVGSRFIYFSVKDDFPLKMDRSCLMPLMANRNLFRAQRSGLSPIKSLHFLKKKIKCNRYISTRIATNLMKILCGLYLSPQCTSRTTWSRIINK